MAGMEASPAHLVGRGRWLRVCPLKLSPDSEEAELFPSSPYLMAQAAQADPRCRAVASAELWVRRRMLRAHLELDTGPGCPEP